MSFHSVITFIKFFLGLSILIYLFGFFKNKDTYIFLALYLISCAYIGEFIMTITIKYTNILHIIYTAYIIDLLICLPYLLYFIHNPEDIDDSKIENIIDFLICLYILILYYVSFESIRNNLPEYRRNYEPINV